MPDGNDTPPPRLDTAALGSLLRERREQNNLSLRQAAADAGVSFSTFSRVEDGSQPDLATFTRLCAWLGISPTAFFEQVAQRHQTGIELAITHLAADPRLSPRAAKQITATLRQMYEALAVEIAQPERTLALHLRATSTMRPGVPERLGSLLHDMQDQLAALVARGEL